MTPEVIIILTAVLVAASCALVGTFLILRKMAMLGDAISHAVLPGIAIAFFLAGGPAPLPVLIGAAALGLLTVTLVEALYRSRRVKEDAAIGLVFPALFALGVFLVSRFGSNVHLDTQHVLYGEIAYAPWDTLVIGDRSLGPKPLWVLGFVTLLDLAFVLAFYKELKLVTFDAGLATALGFSPVLVHYLLMAAVSITTVAAFDSVGAILVVALLIVPPATARLLTDRLPTTIGLAVGTGILSAIFGYLLAREVDGSIAGAMATVAGVLFGIALLFSPRHGLLAWLIRQARLHRQFAVDLLLLHLVEHEQAIDRHAPPAARPTGGEGGSASPVAALQARLRWSPKFTRAVLRQVLAEGLVQPARPVTRNGPAHSISHVEALDAQLTVTERGRARAAELLARG